MIFYRINSTPPQIVGTQDDARSAAREAKVDWEQIDIPTDKAGLMAYVNELIYQGASSDRAAEAALNAVIDIPRPEAAVHQSQESFTASEIEDFLLNRATLPQCENIFACLGTRFAEKRAAA